MKNLIKDKDELANIIAKYENEPDNYQVIASKILDKGYKKNKNFNILKYIIIFIIAFHYGYMINQTYFPKNETVISDNLPLKNGEDITITYEDNSPKISMSYDTYKYIIKHKQIKDVEEKIGVLLYRMTDDISFVNVQKINKNIIHPILKENKIQPSIGCNWNNCSL